MAKADLTAARLRELLDYDPGTGVFTWLVRSALRVRIGQEAGCRTQDGYTVIAVDGMQCKAHRLAWLYVNGNWPTGQIDHVNGDRGDNRICNLRDVSHALNQQNKRSVSENAAGVIGVTPVRGRFRARIKSDGRLVSLGTYMSAELAYAAYVEAKRQMHPGNTL